MMRNLFVNIGTAPENNNGGDMKIEKFKMMVKETDKYLFCWNHMTRYWEWKSKDFDFYHYNFLKFQFYNGDKDNYQYTYYIPDFIDKYNNNEFVKVLTNEMHDFSDYDSWKYEKPKFISASEAIDRFRDDKYSTDEFRLIFWLLFLASINDDIYNEELSTIIDLAYCLGFNEQMLSDWCKAVEYVLSGNFFDIGCDFNCETAEGERFFLVKED